MRLDLEVFSVRQSYWSLTVRLNRTALAACLALQNSLCKLCDSHHPRKRTWQVPARACSKRMTLHIASLPHAC
jgi:hypothetical protein